jgi:hypothetical protein
LPKAKAENVETVARNGRYLREFGERPGTLYWSGSDIHLRRVSAITPAVFVESEYYRYRILVDSSETRGRAKGSAEQSKGGMVNAGCVAPPARRQFPAAWNTGAHGSLTRVSCEGHGEGLPN